MSGNGIAGTAAIVTGRSQELRPDQVGAAALTLATGDAPNGAAYSITAKASSG